MRVKEYLLKKLLRIRCKLFFMYFGRNYWDKNHIRQTFEAPYSTTSSLCTSALFDMPFFRYWINKLKLRVRYKRKQWEFVYVCQTLFEHGMLTSGKRGLVFGCGKEPLAALFASMGCQITATDLDITDSRADVWTNTNQHIKGNYITELNPRNICDENTFLQNVTYRDVDMNDIPEDLTGYDFCWSCSSLEHIGSIKNGLNFIKNSMKTLKKGGIAVHITEFNLSSDDDTIHHENLALFREKDIRRLIAELEAEGHKVYPLLLEKGNNLVDKYIDNYPYNKTSVHLKLRIGEHVFTSLGLIIEN